MTLGLMAECIPNPALQTLFLAARESAIANGNSEALACLKGYRAVEDVGATYADGIWKISASDEDARIYVPPVEVIEAAKSATEPAEFTAILAAGDALNAAEIRKVALHFAKAEGEPAAAWGGRHGLKWAGRIMRKLHAEPQPEFEIVGSVVKVDEEQRLIFGWFSIVEIGGKVVTDSQNDQISPATIEAAAYDYVLRARVASEMHQEIGVGDLVESVVFTNEKAASMQKSLNDQGIPAVIQLGCQGWWGGFKLNPAVFERVKSGDLKEFSIGGKAKREKLAA